MGSTGLTAGTVGPDGGLYTSQAQTGLPNNGYGSIAGGTRPADGDNDGMSFSASDDHFWSNSGLDAAAALPPSIFFVQPRAVRPATRTGTKMRMRQ